MILVENYPFIITHPGDIARPYLPITIINPENQKEISIGNGITIAYSHNVCIKAFNFSTDNVLIDFMPNLHIPLLGVKSFLWHFTLKIDYPNKIFSIKALEQTSS